MVGPVLYAKFSFQLARGIVALVKVQVFSTQFGSIARIAAKP